MFLPAFVSACSQGYYVSGFGCYFFSSVTDDVISWDEASEACHSLSGYLVTFGTAEEYFALKPHIPCGTTFIITLSQRKNLNNFKRSPNKIQRMKKNVPNFNIILIHCFK